MTCISIIVIFVPAYKISDRDLVINLVATTVDTVCVGSIILILVTSTYRRIVCKMFFFTLCTTDYVAVISLVVLILLKPYYVTRA